MAIAIGLIEAMIGRETCWARVRWSLVSIATGAILVAVALARFSEDLRWGTVRGVMFVAVLAMILAAAGYGLTQARWSRLDRPGDRGTDSATTG